AETAFQSQERQMANAIRALAMDAVEKAKSGHPGMPMGMADVATVLFTKFMKVDATHPDWPDRDRFVLSAGHGSMLLYALHYLLGYPGLTLAAIKDFRQLGAPTAGHPEYGHAPGIETTTGPLGQGLANAVGMAMAEAHLAARYGDDLVDHRTYVIAGDGCLMEGISQEAVALAGHLKLRKLIVLWDDNNISIDGPVSLSDSTDQLARFAASGWATSRIDGHDPVAIEEALANAQHADQPVLIACRTTIGFGAPTKAGTSSSHGSPLGSDEIAGARAALGWSHPPFEVPDALMAQWRAAGDRGSESHNAWQARHAGSNHKQAFDAAHTDNVGALLDDAMIAFKSKIAEDHPKVATRKASEMVLEVVNETLSMTLGGSADLTGSNNTKTKALTPFSADDYTGRYIYYGIREHGMAAAMNGMALHGGIIPYGGTFMVFTDYCRPAIRLSALMGIRTIYVMTHDSIGLGEDGPTHQPVEHLAALRAIPNCHVFRPADVIETAECWQLALTTPKTPSILALTRQGLTPARLEATPDNLCAHGAYVIADAPDHQLTLFASGSEVELALKAQASLACDAVRARIVSAPCLDLFASQPDAYRASILDDKPRIAVEAGIRQGWEAILRPEDGFVGMTGFGASGPATDLFEHFGITADAVVAAAKARLA
ncbi:MAG: transketolase, partial [Pseudomonadota bacterium]